MRYQYVVTLKRDSDRTTDAISVLICLFAAFNFLFVQVRAGQPNYFLGLGALIIIGGVIANIIMIRRGRQQVRYRYWLLLCALGWMGMPYLQWVMIFYVLLCFLEYQVKHPLEIGFTGDRVVINTLIRKQYEWSAFSNVVLKDGLLTLDFRNNRILQKEVLDDEEGEADEEEFNDYCRDRLAEQAQIKN